MSSSEFCGVSKVRDKNVIFIEQISKYDNKYQSSQKKIK
jgi:hypothetical protein